MPFRVYYNERFPLRMINAVCNYLEIGGKIMTGNRIVTQLSKLQILDFFFPDLFIREQPGTAEETEYDYETCYIIAVRKHGVLSGSGPYKQKLNDITDCLLGNSRQEQTYRNFTDAHNMLRRASSDMVSKESVRSAVISALRSIFEDQLDESRKAEMIRRMKAQIDQSRNQETMNFCTAKRADGFSFNPQVYSALLERISLLYEQKEYCDCWIWLCLGSLLGNYSFQLLNRYDARFSKQLNIQSSFERYRLIPSPSVLVRPGFVGRDDYLNRINDMFHSGNRVIFLYGIGGIGKTEIARQYATVFRDQYDVIIYVLYENSIRNLVITDMPFETDPPVRRMMIDHVSESDEAFFRRKLNIIRRASSERTLIILDNFNTANDDQLNDLIDGRYRILVTTQFDWSTWYPSVKVREITDMESLITIFMNHYHGFAVERDDPDLEKLIRLVNCHTFTVILLAHHMENSGQSAAGMLEALRKEGIVSLYEKVSVDSDRTDEAYLNLIRMFRVSDCSPEEQRVLQLLSLLPLSGTDAKVFIRWAGLSSASVLLDLERREWLIRNGNNISLHPVVQKVIQFTLPVHDSSAVRPFLDRVADSLINDSSWHYTKAEKEQYCAIASGILNTVNFIDDSTYRFFRASASIFSYSGYPKKAVSLFTQLYEYCCSRYGMYTFESADSAYRIGWTYLFNPQMDHALESAEDWLQKGRKILIQAAPVTVDQKAMYCGLLENLSKAYSLQYELGGDEQSLENARKYAEQSVTYSRKWLTDYITTKKSPAGSLLRLADIHMSMKSYEEAEKLIDEAYEILTSMFDGHGDMDPDILRATSRKAKVLFYLGHYEESLHETDQNLAAYPEFYEEENPSYFDQLVLKVRNCIHLNMKDEASSAKKEALRIGRMIYSPKSAKLQFLNSLE